MPTDDTLSNDGIPFLMRPAQHRRRAQDLRDAGRPDLARNHDICALIIEHRRRRMH